MGRLIEFRRDIQERRKLLDAIRDMEYLIATVAEPEMKASYQAHLDRYKKRLEVPEN